MRDTGSLDSEFGGKPLSAENLARDFGARADVTREGIRALYEVLVAGRQPDALEALDTWRRQVSGACGHEVEQPTPAVDALADSCAIPVDGLRPAEMLFALHTYYAVLVKLLAWQILASYHKLSAPAERLKRARSSGRLQHEIGQLEAGDVFQALDVVGPLEDDPFSWYTAAWDEPIERMIRRLAGRFVEYDARTLSDDPAGSRDLFKALYGDLFPRRLRHMLGEYYTPDWLARHVLDEVGHTGRPDARLLDPACGSGTFLLMAIRRVRTWHEANRGKAGVEPGELCRKILASVVGFDLNPLAVLSARANYLIAICDLLGHAGRIEIPVFLRDSILTPEDNAAQDGTGSSPGGTAAGTAGQVTYGTQGKFDYVVGNPPWIAWDDLPADYRHKTKPLWRRYGLFSLSGSDARHGGGKKDLSMLMLYAAADRYLTENGRLAMVVTQTLFQTKGAGDGFRRFRLGSGGPWLRVLRVNDLVALRPFPGAANWTATIVLEKGARTTYPVPYVKWSLERSPPENERDWDGRFRRRPCQAEPIDPDRPTSPWFIRPHGLETDWARLVGPSDYQAHLGANSGGANGVYWVTVLGEAEGGVLVRNVATGGKRGVESVQHVVEPDLLYPLLRWADIARYRAVPSAHLLLVQDVEARRGVDEATMRRRYPRTYAYLRRFAPVLSNRAAYKRYQQRAAFYSMYNVGRYTVASAKVVWRRMDRRINAAVVDEVEAPLLGPRAVIPQETCVLVAAESFDEAHYLCAVLNSAIVGFLVASHSVRGGKGFGTPSMLDFIRLRRFEPDDPLHRELASSSRLAHQAVSQGEDLAEIQHKIDEQCGRLWGLGQRELGAIRRELEDDSMRVHARDHPTPGEW